MKGWKKLVHGIVLTAAGCFCASPLLAQQEGGEEPKPAAREYPPLFSPSGNQPDTDQETQAIQPDNLPVSGVQNPTLGTPEMRHSYWVPGIQYSNIAGSSSSSPAVNTGWNTTSFVTGNVSLLEAWSHSILSANYSGGGFSSTDQVQGSGQFQQLAATYEIEQRRWNVLLVDQFSYLPQSAFGFGGTSGLASPGITGSLSAPLPTLQSTYVPGQTILTAFGTRYSNVSSAQLTYQVSRRGSITVAGVHGLLRFSNTGNISSDIESLDAGYNYAITRKDTLGLFYRFSSYHFPGDPQALGDHAVELVYGRKITGRLALRLSGGPEITTFRMPVNGLKQTVSGSGTGSLSYAFPRSNVSLDYTHGTSSGSGVFAGASTDQIRATWSRQFSKVWSGSLNFGYAKNREIVSVSALTSPSFDSWFAGAGLSRPLGRTASFSLNYQAQIEGANVAVCKSPSCGTNYTTHQIFLSFQWHTRPLVLR